MVISSFLFKQLIMSSLLDEFAVGKDDDLVSFPDSREAMGDSDGGSSYTGLFESELDCSLRLGVQC